jgi:SWI/SNF-related matrix-associated actin-dependent regulator 1 of chromatin subfamily A
VLKDLPEKTRTVVPLALNGNEGIYTSALREALGAWENEKPDPLRDITQISALRQAAMDAKFSMCKEWLDNFLETGRKLVVFDIHHKTTDRLMEKYGKIAVALDGRVDSRLRSKVVERFQTDPKVQMLIGNVQVAGTGFTMTAAQDAVFLEYPWTPGELSQSEDRIHRIGQKGAANIYYLVAQNTLEEDIIQLIEEKRKVLNGVLDGVYDESTSILAELTKRLKQKGKQK